MRKLNKNLHQNGSNKLVTVDNNHCTKKGSMSDVPNKSITVNMSRHSKLLSVTIRSRFTSMSWKHKEGFSQNSPSKKEGLQIITFPSHSAISQSNSTVPYGNIKMFETKLILNPWSYDETQFKNNKNAENPKGFDHFQLRYNQYQLGSKIPMKHTESSRKTRVTMNYSTKSGLPILISTLSGNPIEGKYKNKNSISLHVQKQE